ncbi:MAG: alginate export family protein [Candidatus Thiodiazotropha endolucinida]
MRQLIPVTIIFSLLHASPASAQSGGRLYTDFEIGIEFNELDGLNLGSEAERNRLVEQEMEFEFDFEYWVNDKFNLFFTGALIDENETIKSADMKTTRTGLEFRELGVAYLFGDIIDSEINLGRVEYESISQWWSWWDDELDIISLQLWFGDFETFLAMAEEQAPESMDEDFIDPELDDVQRLIFSMSWEIMDGQILNFYYLKHNDNSPNYRIGDLEDIEKIDEEDADLIWKGISYVAGIEHHVIGEIDLELHYSEMSGRSAIYEFEDSSSGVVEVSEREDEHINGTASGYLLRWTPRGLDEFSLIIAGVKGSGDSDLGDRHNKSYRQTGLQGDLESYGELYQPELSNLKINMFGLQWRIAENMSFALMHFDYRQDKLSDEIRDATIEVDPSGASRDLGKELDMVYSIEYEETLELFFTYAKFKPGSAYADYRQDSTDYIGIDFAYKF